MCLGWHMEDVVEMWEKRRVRAWGKETYRSELETNKIQKHSFRGETGGDETPGKREKGCGAAETRTRSRYDCKWVG